MMKDECSTAFILQHSSFIITTLWLGEQFGNQARGRAAGVIGQFVPDTTDLALPVEHNGCRQAVVLDRRGDRVSGDPAAIGIAGRLHVRLAHQHGRLVAQDAQVARVAVALPVAGHAEHAEPRLAAVAAVEIGQQRQPGEAALAAGLPDVQDDDRASQIGERERFGKAGQRLQLEAS